MKQYGNWRGAFAELLNSEGEAKILQRHKSEKSLAWKVQTVNSESGEVKLWRVSEPVVRHHGLCTLELINKVD